MERTATAEEFFSTYGFDVDEETLSVIVEAMIDFTKMHLENQLEAIKNNDLNDIDIAYSPDNVI